MKIISLSILLSSLLMTSAAADTISIASASNFTQALKQLSKVFESNSTHKITIAFASTGKQYAQIMHGAPFDIFFAADSKRPKLLDEAGITVPKTRFTYAIGKLVLWSPDPSLVDKQGKMLKNTKRFQHLSIANPKLAPYGKAAKEILVQRGLWEKLRGRTVRGENIGQAFQFVTTNNAELGFIAYSQIKQPEKAVKGSFWIPSQSLYTPIKQQAVLLKESQAAREFLHFIKSQKGQKIIRSFAYEVVDFE